MQVMKYFGTTGITIEYWKYFTWWTLRTRISPSPPAGIPARAAGTARFGPSARPPPSAAGPPPATALPPPLGHLPPPPPCHRRQAPLPTPPSAAGPLSASGLPPPRTASGQLSAPPSPPMEGTGNGAVRLRIYRRSVEEGALTIVTEMTSLAPPQPSGAASYVDKIDTQPDGDTGLYVAFVRGEVVLDVARLCFHGGQQISEDDQEEPTKFLSSSDDNWGCMTSGEEEEVEGQQMGDEDQDEPAYFLTSEYGNWASRTSWEEEVEGGEDEGADDDYDDDEEEEEEEEDEENEEEEEEDLQEKKGGEDEGADDDFDDEEEEEEDEEDEEDLQEKNVPPHWRRLLLLHRTPPYCHRGEGEDAVATVVGKEGEDAIATVVGEEEEEQEEDEDSSSGDKDPEDRKEYPGKDPNMIHIQIKTWLPQKRFLVKISRGGCWVLTKEYCMIWLKIEEVEQLLNEKCFAIGSTVSRRSNCLVEFESMVASPAPLLSEMIKGVIEPSTEDFRMLGLIGRGGSARVFKCLFSGSVCALKATPQDKSMFTEPREIGIISILKDKHVMTFYQAWVEPWSYKQEPERNYVFMHMEFCPRTLEDALLPYQIENKWLGFQEILRGIKYLHGELVVHRDLKPANIFLSTNGVIRIGDFGDACFGHDEFGKYGGTPGCGTANYIAPELDGGEKVTNKVDIYSVGVIFFEIFAMFHTGSERSKVFGTLRDEGPPQGWKGNSELYNKMTAFEPSDRPSAIDVLEYIEEELSG